MLVQLSTKIVHYRCLQPVIASNVHALILLAFAYTAHSPCKQAVARSSPYLLLHPLNMMVCSHKSTRNKLVKLIVCWMVDVQGWQLQLAPTADPSSFGDAFAKDKPHTDQDRAVKKEYGSDLPFTFMPADRSADDVVLALCGQAVNGAVPADARQGVPSQCTCCSWFCCVAKSEPLSQICSMMALT